MMSKVCPARAERRSEWRKWTRAPCVSALRRGDGQGLGGDVDGGNLGLGEFEGEGNGQDAGAGAYIEDAKAVFVRKLVQHGFDEVFGLGARDEQRRA